MYYCYLLPLYLCTLPMSSYLNAAQCAKDIHLSTKDKHLPSPRGMGIEVVSNFLLLLL